ncbi:MAG: lipid A deacylase LpxR family protein [Gammaproteobacteria bacterium]|nr:lipid A deacylase LpxR family protein [Gammaproteobacteria bacterium]MBU1645638.1 lipid A deacylase LpxR family protein [Gammaproteobacteria bacterium]MBU1973560.1 lipid A deacylase LpxR family protein [Gammaproteobacteria bacterium]
MATATRPARAAALRFAAALLLAVAALPAAAAPFKLKKPPEGSEVQVFIENDMLARTDRYYTNGIKIGLGLPFEILQTPAAEVLRGLDPDGGEDIHVGLFLGQNMYTPRDITIAAAQPNDRPWAAWLYLGGVAQRARGNRLDTVELDLGVVGRAALGEPVQKAWHRLIDVKQPRGWDNQGPTEAAAMLSYLQKRRYGNDSIDIVAHGGATVGTVLTQARAGLLLRLGERLSGFGPDTIEPGGAMLHGTRAQGAPEPGGVAWYVFAGFDHRLVAHNIFLDGPVFHDGPKVKRHNHVRDLMLGASVRVNRARFSWTRVERSEEFHTAAGGGGTQRFDSLNLGFEF